LGLWICVQSSKGSGKASSSRVHNEGTIVVERERCGRVIRSVADFYINRFVPPVNKNRTIPSIRSSSMTI
jgi:hypothetical protein